MARRLKYPECPKKSKDDKPRYRGRIQIRGSQLLYLDPMTGEFKPAVRLSDIRAELLRQENPDRYDHQKDSGLDVTDRTTFLLKDKAYGGDRNNRPALLFQINKPAGTRGQRPTSYSMHGGRIILDGFDHGIRAFDELPKALSSALKGHDIVWYFRQNQFITLYDLMSRMPNGFHDREKGGAWHDGPPASNTISMRATRFRKLGGLLEWSNKGSDQKNEKILDIIPQSFKRASVNSTRHFRDFTDQEQVSLEKLGSARRRAKNISKNKRANEQQVGKQKNNSSDDEEEENEFDWDQSEESEHDWEGEDISSSDTADKGNYDSEQENEESTLDTTDGGQDDEDRQHFAASKRNENGKILAQGTSFQSTSGGALHTEVASSPPGSVPEDCSTQARDVEVEGSDQGHIVRYRRGQQTPKEKSEKSEKSREEPMARQPKRKRSREEEPESSDEEPIIQYRKRQRAEKVYTRTQSLNDTGYGSPVPEGSKLVKSKTKKGAFFTRRRSAGATTSCLPLYHAYREKHAVPGEVMDTSEDVGNGRDAEPAPGNADQSSDRQWNSYGASGIDLLYKEDKALSSAKPLKRLARETGKRGGAKAKKTSEESTKEDDHDAQLYLTAREGEAITGDDPLTAWIADGLARQRQLVNNKQNPAYPVDPQLVNKHRDYRYVWPTIHNGSLTRDIDLIKDALAPTRADFKRRVGYPPPKVLEEEYDSESYNCQYLRMQELYAKTWRGVGSQTPQLYRLPAWTGGFENWRDAYKKDVDFDGRST